MQTAVQELRRLIGAIDGTHKKETYSFSLLETGFPKGGLIEISGSGKTELTLAFLKEHRDLKVAWLEKDLSIFPLSFSQKKAGLNRTLFIEAGSELNWT